MFVDRVDAGRQLAERLRYLPREDVVVLGLPRGGVPVAFEVAQALNASLDVILVRKLGVPSQPELGMGAIGEDGVRIINRDVVRLAGVTDQEIAAVEERERAELERRAQRYRSGRPRLSLTGGTAIVVDDGIATGSTARAACRVARAQGAAHVVLAVPVAPPGWTVEAGYEADELISLQTPAGFYAIGQWYSDFSQTTDEEVIGYLDRPITAPTWAEDGQENDPRQRDEEVEIYVSPVALSGHLTIPEQARGIVVFAHGSGSSRHSPRNRFVAGVLNQSGLGTLLFDLLTMDEEQDRANVFDIELLAGRLVGVTRWLASQPEALGLPIGYFGASTGAAAALWAATEPDTNIAAVVSRGGRPDLAGPRLPVVTAPTLLIVGSNDQVVIDLNRQAQALLRCESRLAVVRGATHLFEEPGTLLEAAELARDWFLTEFTPS